MTGDERADEALYQAANEGDREAANELKSRFVSSLYDFALRTSLDPAVAGAAVSSALTRLEEGSAYDHRVPLRSAVLASLRDEVLETLRGRGEGNGERASGLSVNDPAFAILGPGAPANADAELAAWAWQAARSQRPRDYSLLDMNLRRGIAADELAEATEMSHSGIYAILGRLRGAFEETYTSTLLFHRGREACPELATLTQGQQGLGPALRREIARHLEGCANCRQTRRRFPSPATLLEHLAPLRPADELAAAGMPAAAAESPEDAASLQGALPLAAGGGAAIEEVAVAEEVLPVTEEVVVEEAIDEDKTIEPARFEEPPRGIEEVEPQAVEPEAVGPAIGVTEYEVSAAEEVSEEPPLAVEGLDAVAAGAGAGDEQNAIAGVRPAGTREPEAVLPDESVAQAIEAAGAWPTAAHLEADEVYEEAEASVERPEAEDSPKGWPPATPAGLAPAASGPFAAAGAPGAPTRRLGTYGDGGVPPRRPWDRLKGWFDEQGPARISLGILFAGALVLAVYLGLALGESIEGGGKSGSGAALPTTTPGVSSIGCGTAPHLVEQGSVNTLSFESRALAGYQMATTVGVRAVSANAAAQAIQAVARPPFDLVVTALPLAGPPGRIDEYVITVTFTRQGQPNITSECTVQVRAPAVTATPPPASPTAQPSPTPTPTPRPPTAVVPAPTSTVPPTAAPPSATPTSALPTSTPTISPVPSATRTATPTVTPTPTQPP